MISRELLFVLPERKCVMKTSNFFQLIGRRARRGDIEEGRKLVEILSQEFGHSPNIMTFGVLAMCCSNLKTRYVRIKLNFKKVRNVRLVTQVNQKLSYWETFCSMCKRSRCGQLSHNDDGSGIFDSTLIILL